MSKTKQICICALMAALCVAVMSLASLIQVLDASLALVAGLIVAIIATEFGDRSGWAVFAVAGLLSLLLPKKEVGVCFLALAGWYPIVQKKIHMLSPVLCRVVKEAVFNVVLVAYLFVSVKLLGLAESKTVLAVIFILANLCFVLYDILLDRMIILYIVKIRKRLGFK